MRSLSFPGTAGAQLPEIDWAAAGIDPELGWSPQPVSPDSARTASGRKKLDVSLIPTRLPLEGLTDVDAESVKMGAAA
jgi:hypothetical protein